MDTLPLEDNVSDIISKAQKGWPLSPEEAEKAGKYSTLSLEEQTEVAQKLHLGAAALKALAENRYAPVVELPLAFKMITTSYGNMTVNAFIIWNTTTKAAVLFDTGGDAVAIVNAMQGLSLEAIFLTHAHGDHVGELERLLEKLPAAVPPRPIYVAQAEFSVVEALGVAGLKAFSPGETISAAGFQIESRDASGHSAGLVAYAIHGLDRPVTIVGDSIFAGSVGGIRGDYSDTLLRIKKNILSSQTNTILACGHGPLTTVGQELVNNPFFTI